jgi:hypothetical protein
MTLIFDTIQLSNLLGTKTLDLPIVTVDPQSSYILKDVIGLGPPEINVAMLETLSQGGIHQLSKALSREVVMRIRLNPDYSLSETVADLRNSLYGFLSVGKAPLPPMYIKLLSGINTVAQIQAYIKKFEIVPFAKEPEVQVTFACVKSFLEGPAQIEINTGTLDTLNPQIDNTGTAPTGFYMQLTFSDPSEYFSITSSDDISLAISIGYSFQTGDVLTIDTQPGTRYVGRTRSGSGLDLYNELDSDAVWLTLQAGINGFICDPISFAWNDVHFTPQYWGI